LAVKNSSTPAATIASLEIGALAYFSDRPVVDIAGLLSIETREARMANDLASLIRSSPPDYFLDNPAFHSSGLKQIIDSGVLQEKYLPFAYISRPEYPYELVLLRRRLPI
jgi:hypothetical protein